MNALDLPVDARPATSVRPFREGDHAAWSAFVASCPEATFFHRVEWRGLALFAALLVAGVIGGLARPRAF